jgi:hypothetical protein
MTSSGSGEDSRKPDAFISHSSRDKQQFVRPLVGRLADHGAGSGTTSTRWSRASLYQRPSTEG